MKKLLVENMVTFALGVCNIYVGECTKKKAKEEDSDFLRAYSQVQKTVGVAILVAPMLEAIIKKKD